VYMQILSSLKLSHENIWFTTCYRLGKIYLQYMDFQKVDKLLLEMKQACKLPGMELAQGLKSFNQEKANHLMKIFSLEFLMCDELEENSRKLEVLQTIETITNDCNFRVFAHDSEVMGRIYEISAKKLMSEAKWKQAASVLQQSMDYLF
jgi:hypothetical protein